MFWRDEEGRHTVLWRSKPYEPWLYTYYTTITCTSCSVAETVERLLLTCEDENDEICKGALSEYHSIVKWLSNITLRLLHESDGIGLSNAVQYCQKTLLMGK